MHWFHPSLPSFVHARLLCELLALLAQHAPFILMLNSPACCCGECHLALGWFTLPHTYTLLNVYRASYTFATPASRLNLHALSGPCYRVVLWNLHTAQVPSPRCHAWCCGVWLLCGLFVGCTGTVSWLPACAGVVLADTLQGTDVERLYADC